ncbi:tryptophan-rich sensory protein [Candidatus Dependentiae bacterium]|nr:tryptophan-rich sensory protein [Candidatus Dependentiae bacterium]
MMINFKKAAQLFVWIFVLLAMSFVLGKITRGAIPDWYEHINRSPLTPPNYTFGIVWPILYILIALGGWMIWDLGIIFDLTLVKKLYVFQLILNWSWSPLFFAYKSIGAALICLIALVFTVCFLIYELYTDERTKNISFLFAPYAFWLFFAMYLNWFIWMNN